MFYWIRTFTNKQILSGKFVKTKRIGRVERDSVRMSQKIMGENCYMTRLF